MKNNKSLNFPVPFSSQALNQISDDEFVTILLQNRKMCLFCKPTSAKKILIETKHFYVTFDDSPLLEGHLMIHTKTHYGCGGEIPEELFAEFIGIKNRVLPS